MEALIIVSFRILSQVTLGRSTADHSVDIDLSLEGPAWKVSRRQACIRMRNNGDFFIANEGKRPIYVDGRPIIASNKYKLNHNSIIEVRSVILKIKTYLKYLR